MTKPANSDGTSFKAEGTSKTSKLPPAPSTGTAVNLAIAEIVLRGVADRMRGRVNADISKVDARKRESGERDAVDGRSLLTSVGLYGAASLAKKSRAGLGLVAGGLLAKSLYERGKAVRETRSKLRVQRRGKQQ
ncbi:MAG: hypothetical protein ABJ205_11160 [Erythrobacter sp.]|uniref:hypothetical protein n=1 Tax=Erythrobacter sp. TaxID=1042 RepID=UPI003265B857